MTYNTIVDLVHTIQHYTNPGLPAGVLLIVAAYISICAIMYWFSRGREYLYAGYTGMLFLMPFVNFNA